MCAERASLWELSVDVMVYFSDTIRIQSALCNRDGTTMVEYAAVFTRLVG